MDGYRHYIRVDSNNIVIDGYADWETEKRKPDEIALQGEFIRQFQFQIINDRGQFVYKLENGQMVDRTQDADYLLMVARQNKLEAIKAAEEAALQTFQSSALGTPHTYLAGTNDMILLAAEYGYLKGDDYDGQPILWYTVEEGNVSHTKVQFIQAYLDGRSHVASTKYHRATLEYQVSQATTADEVNAITV